VYLKQQRQLAEQIQAALRSLYQIEVETVVLEQPPELAFGEYATPIAFELARRLRKAPRKIAEEIVTALGSVPGFASIELAGAGYINARLDRGSFAQAFAASGEIPVPSVRLHSLVEHTSINPNKAAHVGHLRNAILGDTFVRLLKAAGQKVDVQNYVDNTGVQVADVVVGFLHLPQDNVPGMTREEEHTLAGVRKLMAYLDKRRSANPAGREASIDYYCWNLYARVSTWYQGIDTDPFEADPERIAKRKQIRLETLHSIESGNNEVAQIAELVSTAILRRHL